jgi:hypothetical protein
MPIYKCTYCNEENFVFECGICGSLNKLDEKCEAISFSETGQKSSSCVGCGNGIGSCFGSFIDDPKLYEKEKIQNDLMNGKYYPDSIKKISREIICKKCSRTFIGIYSNLKIQVYIGVLDQKNTAIDEIDLSKSTIYSK